MIVKVQLSLMSNAQVLVYNKNRNKTHMGVAPKGLEKMMGGEYKKFFYATIKNKEFILGEEAPWQSW